MKIAKKELSWYVDSIKWPVIVLAVWSIVGALVLRQSSETYMNIFGNQWASMFLPIVMYLLAGYIATADHQATAKQAAWSGALTGIIVSLLGVIILIASFSATVNLSAEQAVIAAAEQGQSLSIDEAIPIVKIGTYVSVVIGPVIAGLFGALIGWIGYLVANKVEGKK